MPIPFRLGSRGVELSPDQEDLVQTDCPHGLRGDVKRHVGV